MTLSHQENTSIDLVYGYTRSEGAARKVENKITDTKIISALGPISWHLSIPVR